MKHQKRNLAMTLLVTIALCLSLFLTSCNFPWEISASIGEPDRDYDGELEEKPTDNPSVKPPYNADDELPDSTYPPINNNNGTANGNSSSGVTGAGARRRKCRQKHRRQNCNNGNYHQKFDQGKVFL